MAKTVSPTQSQSGSVPTQPPQTTPQAYSPADHSFTMQTFMEIQKNLGQINQAITTLTEESKKNNAKLDEVSHKVYAAQVTLKVVGSVLGIIGSGALFLFWKIWAGVAPLIQLQIKPPHP